MGATMKFPILRNQKWMRDRYLGDELEVSEIAGLVGCSAQSVRQWLVRHNLYQPQDYGTPIWYSKEDLLAAAGRVDSWPALCEELGLARNTIQYTAYRVGLTMDDLRQAFQERHSIMAERREEQALRKEAQARARAEHREVVRRMYVDEGLGIKEIGEALGLHESGVFRLLNRMEIDTTQKRKRAKPEKKRPATEAIEAKKDEIIAMLEDERSVTYISRRLELNRPAMYAVLRRWGVKPRGAWSRGEGSGRA